MPVGHATAMYPASSVSSPCRGFNTGTRRWAKSLDSVIDEWTRRDADAERSDRARDISLVARREFGSWACALGNLEGIVSKWLDRIYRSGSTMNWRKIKCYVEKEMEIIGAQRERGNPAMVLMADKGRYMGSAFVTFRADKRQALWDRVQGKVGAPPPKGLSKQKAEWLEPGLVGGVKFLKGEEQLRHASLKDFREERAPVEPGGAMAGYEASCPVKSPTAFGGARASPAARSLLFVAGLLQPRLRGRTTKAIVRGFLGSAGHLGKGRTTLREDRPVGFGRRVFLSLTTNESRDQVPLRV